MGARRKQLLEPLVNDAQSEVTSASRVWYQSFALSSKENGKANALTASSSSPVLLVVAQMTSKSLIYLIGSSPGQPWNLGNRFIRPDLSSKFALSSGNLAVWLSSTMPAPPICLRVSLSPMLKMPASQVQLDAWLVLLGIKFVQFQDRTTTSQGLNAISAFT
ncbi:hypothetical protein PIB30_094273 [Stylosanthes scabra]|uniref:Uncharacterized protein n=1 Tax=Stylosanthes scabra TaxID=79078 RepID=A0ABU6RVB8_9FABA|nr:hypothetical protein [Stylosanthes scabra]